MKNSRLRLIYILASICAAGIVATQAYWVQRAYTIEDKQFDLNVNIALRDAAFKVWEFKQSQAPMSNVVSRPSPDYFIVKINEHVDKDILEHFLKESFINNNVLTDFVYGLHDCMNNKMQYQDYVDLSTRGQKEPKNIAFPNVSFQNYYFAVYFPHRAGFLRSQLTLWTISSVFLVGVLLFMAYIVYVILQQRRLSEMQKDFVNNMTHEFKTPLASIQLASNVLKKPNITENPTKLFNYANIIETEAKRLETQVERVLQIAHDGRKATRDFKQEVNLNEVLEHVTEIFETRLEDRNASLDLQLPEQAIIINNADKEHLITAFNNLMDNALKYTPENKKPDIKVSLAQDGNFAKVTIADNGIGIQKSHLKRIFDRFYRVPTGNVHNVKGFGIGLNYVRSIIQEHKGKIMCNSNLDMGTTFEILLPK